MARNLGELVVQIGASVDGVQRKLGGLTQQVQRTQQRTTQGIRSAIQNIDRNLNRFADQAERTFNNLEGNVKNTVTNIKLLGPALKTVGVIGGAAVAAAASVPLLMKGFEAATDELDAFAKNADRLGLSVQFFAGLRSGSAAAGVSIEQLNDNLRQFNTNLFNASGQDRFSQTLGQLGFDLDRFQQLDAQTRIEEVADAISGVPDPSQRAAVAVALFGESGRDLVTVFANGSAGLAEYQAAAERAGGALDRQQLAQIEAARDAISNFGATMEGVKNQFLVAFAPLFQGLADWIQEMNTSGDVIRKTMETLAMATARLIQGLELSIRGWRLIWHGFAAGVQWVTARTFEGLEILREDTESAINGIANFILSSVEFVVNEAISMIQITLGLADRALSLVPGFQSNLRALVPGGATRIGISGNTGRSTGPHVDIRLGSGQQPSQELIDQVLVDGAPLSDFQVTSGYGPRVNPVTGRQQFHTGIDFAVPTGRELLFTGPTAGPTTLREQPGGGGIISETPLPNGDTLMILHLSPETRNIQLGSGLALDRANITVPGEEAFEEGQRIYDEAAQSNIDAFNRLAQQPTEGEFFSRFLQNRNAPFTAPDLSPGELLPPFEEDEEKKEMKPDLPRELGDLSAPLREAVAAQERLNEVEAFRIELMVQEARWIDERVGLYGDQLELQAQLDEAAITLNEALEEGSITQEEYNQRFLQLQDAATQLTAQREQQVTLERETEQIRFFTESMEQLQSAIEDLETQYVTLTTLEETRMLIAEQDVILTAEQISSLETLASEVDRVAAAQERMQQQMQLAQELQQIGSNALQGLFQSLITGSQAADQVLNQFFSQLLDNLLNLGINTLFSSLLGGGGQRGGFLGGLLGFERGGIAPESGAYLLHAGERVTPERDRAASQSSLELTVVNRGGLRPERESSRELEREEVINEAVRRATTKSERDFQQSLGSGYGTYARSLRDTYQVKRRI